MNSLVRTLCCALLFAAPVARAAACCLSTAVVGNGRLAVWEDGAGGLSSSLSHGTGRWDAWNRYRPFDPSVREDEVRIEAWAMVRLAEAWQLSARVPWVVGMRGVGETNSVGTGIGDVGAAVRWELLSLGAYENVPGLSLSLGVTAPTGRRPELATDALGASSTGRGAWSGSLALAAEYAVSPWFVRLDVGGVVNAPFTRADTGSLQTLGPGLQVALSGGREFFDDKLVVALAARFEHDFPLWLDGKSTTRTERSSLTTSLTAAWKVTSHWTVTGSVSTDALGHLGLAQNQQERLAVTLGVRHGFF